MRYLSRKMFSKEMPPVHRGQSDVCGRSFIARPAAVVAACFLCLVSSSLVRGDDKTTSKTQSTAKADSQKKASDTKYWQEKLKPFFKTHCVDCHSGEKAEAGIDLSKVDENTAIEKERPRWNQIRGLIEIGAMPPPDFEPLPTLEQREEIAAWIDRRINHVDCDLVTDPGRVTLRRLNNREYDNTVRDLLGTDFSPSELVAFPSDGVGNGFDNQGDVLTLSPLQLEKYFDAARLITDRIIVTDREALRKQRGDGGQIPLKEKVTARFLFAEGEYELSTRLDFGDKKEEKATVEILIDDMVVDQVTAGSDRERYSTKADFSAGWHSISVQFVADSNADAPDFRRRLEVEYISIDGPQKGKPALPELHTRLFVAEPGEGVTKEQAAEQIFTPILRRAFRRTPTEYEQQRVLNLVKMAGNEGESFESAVAIGLQSILVSPHFLFRIESEPTASTKSEPLSDDALASRLSYFLWASAPDDALLDQAAAGKLHSEQELEAAAKRMLADDRSYSLVTEFFMQSLGIGGLREVEPDKERFPLWNDQLRNAMRHETELVCQEILKSDRSLLDLLRADFTFINPRLAEFYGVEFDGKTGEELYRSGRGNFNFRRSQPSERRDGRYSREDEWIKIALPENRQGVLTHASVLTLTSNPRDTSPVKRGKWILENILGDPPPAAPPNVPSFDETKKKHGQLTLRRQLEIHRENASCASCHRIMDPLGLGFENFDPTGRWREKDRDQPIDASGELATGEKFQGAKELVKILTARERQIARHFITKLLTYALGRGVEPYDNCTVDQILARAEKDNYRMSTIIQSIVSSDPFRMRRGSLQENAQ